MKLLRSFKIRICGLILVTVAIYGGLAVFMHYQHSDRADHPKKTTVVR